MRRATLQCNAFLRQHSKPANDRKRTVTGIFIIITIPVAAVIAVGCKAARELPTHARSKRRLAYLPQYRWRFAWSQMLSHHDCVRRVRVVVVAAGGGIGHAIGKLRNLQFVIIALVAPKTSSAKKSSTIATTINIECGQPTLPLKVDEEYGANKAHAKYNQLRIGTHARHLPPPNLHCNNRGVAHTYITAPIRQYRRCNVQPL